MLECTVLQSSLPHLVCQGYILFHRVTGRCLNGSASLQDEVLSYHPTEQKTSVIKKVYQQSNATLLTMLLSAPDSMRYLTIE